MTRQTMTNNDDEWRFFVEELLAWYAVHQRALPWRETTDPYRIWISEIILQQTRVDQGRAYYERFIARFPDVQQLYEAEENEVLKLWEGLGYYSRARNIHHAAKQIVEEYDSCFPKQYHELLKLKGVGEYTAGAIASFAYKQCYPAVDGNVYRVLSRIFGISTAIDSGKGKKQFYALAQQLQSREHPDDFNQALIEFGALQCTPKAPNCEACIFKLHCVARKKDAIAAYPFKQGKTKVEDLFLNYFVIKTPLGIALKKRQQSGIWKNMFEFPLLESAKPLKEAQLWSKADFLPDTYHIEASCGPLKHILSHRRIQAHFHVLKSLSPLDSTSYHYINDMSELEAYPLPQLLLRFIQENTALLSLDEKGEKRQENNSIKVEQL